MAKISSFCPGGICANSYLITDEASGLSALVDCGEDSPAMRSFIGGAKLEYILLTHGHFDHIGGAAAIKSEYGARLAVSRQDEPMLSSGKLNLSAFMGGIVPKVTADIIVEEGSVITLGSTEIKVLATPLLRRYSVFLLLRQNRFSRRFFKRYYEEPEAAFTA